MIWGTWWFCFKTTNYYWWYCFKLSLVESMSTELFVCIAAFNGVANEQWYGFEFVMLSDNQSCEQEQDESSFLEICEWMMFMMAQRTSRWMDGCCFLINIAVSCWAAGVHSIKFRVSELNRIWFGNKID